MNLMKYLLFFMLLYPFVLQAQNAPCSEYAAILKKLENTYQNGKGNLDECLDLVESLRACDPNKSELAGTWTKKIFAAIKKQKQDALDATRKAEMSAAAAKKARIRADSIADAAQRAAQRAYANDIAYKSQIALKDGDRTTAYRLAEFAHRYVDNDNLNVTHALVEALYYNDVPDTTHRLPWTANFQGHTSYVSSVAFSPDGSRLATGSSDKTAKIWDLATGKAALTLEGHTSSVSSVAFSPDGSRLATGSLDSTAKIWDLATGKAALTLEGHTSSVSSVAFSPDGSRLATGSDDYTTKIWDLATGKASLTLEGHTSYVYSVAFSPDGSRLATGSDDKTAKIWDLATGKASLTLEGHTSSVLSVAFSPDGSRLATGSYDKTAKIWDLATGKASLTLEGHTSYVLSVAFSPDGSRLATGASDNTAKIWDLATGKASLTLEGHTYSVRSVAFSPDGSRLATGSYDNTAKIWEVTSTSSLAKLAKTGVTWRTPDSTTHLLLLASLTLPQLTAYNLESLLDQHPDNEEKLIASGETWQIAAFADLYAEKIAKSLPRRADYERAQRLYAACLRSGVEEEYFKEKVEELERVWKERGE